MLRAEARGTGRRRHTKPACGGLLGPRKRRFPDNRRARAVDRAVDGRGNPVGPQSLGQHAARAPRLDDRREGARSRARHRRGSGGVATRQGSRMRVPLLDRRERRRPCPCARPAPASRTRRRARAAAQGFNEPPCRHRVRPCSPDPMAVRVLGRIRVSCSRRQHRVLRARTTRASRQLDGVGDLGSRAVRALASFPRAKEPAKGGLCVSASSGAPGFSPGGRRRGAQK